MGQPFPKVRALVLPQGASNCKNFGTADVENLKSHVFVTHKSQEMAQFLYLM